MKQKIQTKRKLTNADILPPPDKRIGITKFRRMGIEKEVIKLRASGYTYEMIREWLDKTYPKKGKYKWHRSTVSDFFYRKRDRIKEVAAMDTSVVDEAAKVAMDTLDTLKVVNKKLWSLLKQLEREEDDSRQQVKTLHAIMRAIEIADRLQTKLPVAEKPSSGSSLSHMEVINSLIDAGLLVATDKNKLTAFVKAKGE